MGVCNRHLCLCDKYIATDSDDGSSTKHREWAVVLQVQPVKHSHCIVIVVYCKTIIFMA